MNNEIQWKWLKIRWNLSRPTLKPTNHLGFNGFPNPHAFARVDCRLCRLCISFSTIGAAKELGIRMGEDMPSVRVCHGSKPKVVRSLPGRNWMGPRKIEIMTSCPGMSWFVHWRFPSHRVVWVYLTEKRCFTWELAAWRIAIYQSDNLDALDVMK